MLGRQHAPTTPCETLILTPTAHPDKESPARILPEGEAPLPEDPRADCFYIHPTVSTLAHATPRTACRLHAIRNPETVDSCRVDARWCIQCGIPLGLLRDILERSIRRRSCVCAGGSVDGGIAGEVWTVLCASSWLLSAVCIFCNHSTAV